MIIPYFGTWPEYMDLYLYSCSKNPQIDFLFFTDCEKPSRIYNNTNFVYTTFGDYCKKVSDRLGIEFNPKSSYKLCDLKPFYGVIHEKEIEQYDWWIFGDLDLILGDLSIIVNPKNMKKYDLITTHSYHIAGHFTMIRKNSKFTRYCFKVNQWQTLLKDEKHIGIDENMWSHVVYPQLSYVRGFFSKIWKPITHQHLFKYLSFANKTFCNRLTRISFIEYFTTPDPIKGQTWTYNTNNGRIYRYDGKELPYLHFFGFKNNCYRPSGYNLYWKSDYYKLNGGWMPSLGKNIYIDYEKIVEQ